jgi:isopenicillin N synthase-like dioxygenase
VSYAIPQPSAEFIDKASDAFVDSAGVVEVTIVDISAAMGPSPSDVSGVAEQIIASFRRTGFAVLTGHGVSDEVFSSMNEVSAEFFALPLEEKLKAGFPAPEIIRGFEPVPESTGPVRAPNSMESFLINQLNVVEDYPAGSASARLWRWPNVWPEQPEALRPVFERYYREMTDLGNRLLEIVALGIGLPQDWFADKFDRHFNNLAANHYPPQEPGAADNGMLRNRPHTDHGGLTLLYRPSEPGGLEVFAEDKWWKVPFVPGSIVLNVGDILERWTGGLIRATPHRVINATGSDGSLGRSSVAYFQQPNPDVVVEPADPFKHREGAAKFTPVTAGRHVARKELGVSMVEALGV